MENKRYEDIERFESLKKDKSNKRKSDKHLQDDLKLFNQAEEYINAYGRGLLKQRIGAAMKTAPKAKPDKKISLQDSAAKFLNELFDKFFSPYPDVITVRAESKDMALAQAMEQYSAKNYKEAAKRFNTILKQEPKNALAGFYAGISYLAEGNTKRGLQNLKKTTANNDNVLSPYAKWYMALAYLQEQNLEKANEILTDLSSKGDKNAKKLLKHLNKLKP